MADSGGIVANGLENAHFGDALAVQGREQGTLQETIHPGFLLAGLELVDADSVEFLFAGKGVRLRGGKAGKAGWAVRSVEAGGRGRQGPDGRGAIFQGATFSWSNYFW